MSGPTKQQRLADRRAELEARGPVAEATSAAEVARLREELADTRQARKLAEHLAKAIVARDAARDGFEQDFGVVPGAGRGGELGGPFVRVGHGLVPSVVGSIVSAATERMRARLIHARLANRSASAHK